MTNPDRRSIVAGAAALGAAAAAGAIGPSSEAVEGKPKLEAGPGGKPVPDPERPSLSTSWMSGGLKRTLVTYQGDDESAIELAIRHRAFLLEVQAAGFEPDPEQMGL
jgi:hypothetical protein